MALYKINLLGPPKIFKYSKEINLSRNKSIALLAYLPDTRRRLSRSEIANIFWPDSNSSNATYSFMD
jgi:DNA-binding SARP family transcriptional activator